MAVTDIPVCILAGGGSRRFGSPKGLAMVGGERLIDVVARRIAGQTRAPLVMNAASDGPYAGLGLPLVEDRIAQGEGPLAGVHAALCWAAAQGFAHVATVPVDVPLLPDDLLARLAQAGAPAIAASTGRAQPLIGLWRSADAETLARHIAGGKRSAYSWAEMCGAREIEFGRDAQGRDPFWNVNTPEDLAALSD